MCKRLKKRLLARAFDKKGIKSEELYKHIVKRHKLK